MAVWTHQICERCWFDTDGKGKISDREVRLPVQVKDANVDEDNLVGIGTCCFCMGPCVTGIFTRHDPALLTCAPLHGPDD